MPFEYEVIEGDDKFMKEFMATVQGYLNDGWKLTGGGYLLPVIQNMGR